MFFPEDVWQHEIMAFIPKPCWTKGFYIVETNDCIYYIDILKVLKCNIVVKIGRRYPNNYQLRKMKTCNYPRSYKKRGLTIKVDNKSLHLYQLRHRSYENLYF